MLNEYWTMASVSSHIYNPVKQEVMDDHLSIQLSLHNKYKWEQITVYYVGANNKFTSV